MDIDQRATAVARIDRRVVLAVDHGRIVFELASHGADHAHADRVGEAEGAANGEDELPLEQLVRIGEGQGRQVLLVDLQHGQVGLEIDTEELRADQFALSLDDGSALILARGGR